MGEEEKNEKTLDAIAAIYYKLNSIRKLLVATVCINAFILFFIWIFWSLIPY